MKNLRKIDNLGGKCKECKNNKKCGGCRAMAYATTKNYLGEDPLCWKK